MDLEAYLNESDLESDPFEGLKEDDMKYYHQFQIPFIMAFAFFEFAVNLISFAFCVIITIILLKYKQLKTILNNYLLHYTALFIFSKAFYPIFNVFIRLIIPHNYTIYLFEYQIERSVDDLIHILVLVLAVHWITTVYYPESLNKVEKFRLLVIIALYIIFFLKAILFTVFDETYYQIRYSEIFYLLVCAALIVLDVVHFRRKGQNAEKIIYFWLFANIFTFSQIPLFIVSIFVDFRMGFNPWTHAVFVIADCLPVSCPIILFFILWRSNKYFKMVLIRWFKKSTRSYEQSDLDQASEEEERTAPTTNGIETDPQYSIHV